jgi:hypothetical protein
MTDTADKEPNLPPLPAPHSFIGFSDVKRATEDVYSAAQMREYALAALSAVQAVPGWRDIESAPKDGTEILAWREDCGPFMAKWSSAEELRTMTDKEREELDEESRWQEDWFGGDSEMGGFRCDGSEAPTHWQPLPAAPIQGAQKP